MSYEYWEQCGIKVHPTAIVEVGAKIGQGTNIWHHAHIRNSAVIGKGCTIGKNVYIDVDVEIGDYVKIQNNVSVYKGVHLADEVFVGPSVVFTNDLYPRILSDNWEVVETTVEKGVGIGANATIVCDVTLGEYCMVGAGSVVTHYVPPHTIVLGNPAVGTRKVCKCGSPMTTQWEGKAPLIVCEKCGFELER